MKSTLPFAFLALSVSTLGAQAQSAPAPAGTSPAPTLRAAPPDQPAIATATAPGGIVINAVRVSESRSSRGGNSNLFVMVGGPGLPPGSSLRNATVTGAFDNAGRNLLSLGTGPARFGPTANPLSMGMTLSRAGASTGMNATLSFGVAPRESTHLKVVEGELEIYNPVATPAATIVVKDLKSRAGKPIEELVKHGIEFVYLTKETWPAFQTRLAAAAGSPAAAGLASRQPNFDGEVVVYISDPQARLAGSIFRDAGGRPIRQVGWSGSGSATTGMLAQASLEPGLPPDAEIAFHLLLPEAISTVTFRFEDIALP